MLPGRHGRVNVTTDRRLAVNYQAKHSASLWCALQLWHMGVNGGARAWVPV